MGSQSQAANPPAPAKQRPALMAHNAAVHKSGHTKIIWSVEPRSATQELGLEEAAGLRLGTGRGQGILQERGIGGIGNLVGRPL